MERKETAGQGVIAFARYVFGIIFALTQIRKQTEAIPSLEVPRSTLPTAPISEAEAARLAQEKECELRRTMFKEYQDHLWTLRQSNIEHSDSLILTLSAAILGLSISFVKDLVPLARAVHLECLLISWGLLSAAIMSTLVSYSFGRRDMDLQSEYAKEYYIQNKKEFFNKTNPWQKITGWCNTASAWAFSLGVILLIYFVSLNLYLEQGYQKKLAKVALVSAPALTTSSQKGATIKP